MPDTILLVAAQTSLDIFLSHSLMVEGFAVIAAGSPPEAAFQNLSPTKPDLILINALDQPPTWITQAEVIAWPAPFIILASQPQPVERVETSKGYRLTAPFSFQDLLSLVQNILYHQTIDNSAHSLQLSATVLGKVETVLTTLRQNLYATCVILSTSSGWLIKTVGEVDQWTATSLAALMSASFSATARAAQILGHKEMFDSNLQESEGYGLYAIRLQEQLILSVAFSSKVTIGMVRYYTAQLAADILGMLDHETRAPHPEPGLDPNADLSQTINQALDELLNNLSDIYPEFGKME